MSSYEFEVAAKNAVIAALAERDILVTIKDLELVWFAHLLGNKKCLIYGREMENLYAEVTFRADTMMMYVDLYQKIANIPVDPDSQATMVLR